MGPDLISPISSGVSAILCSSPGLLITGFVCIAPAAGEWMGIWLKSCPKRDALSKAELIEVPFS